MMNKIMKNKCIRFSDDDILEKEQVQLLYYKDDVVVQILTN